jgi:hypothetical protein
MCVHQGQQMIHEQHAKKAGYLYEVIYRCMNIQFQQENRAVPK